MPTRNLTSPLAPRASRDAYSEENLTSAQKLAELRRGRSRRTARRRARIERELEREEFEREEIDLLNVERAPVRAARFDNVVDLDAARAARLAETQRWEEASRRQSARREESPESAPQTEKTSVAASNCPPCHWGLVVLTLFLTLASIPLIYSASTAIALDHHGRPDFFLSRQAMYAVLGVVALWGASRLSSQGLRIAVWGLYAVALLGLLATDFSPLGQVMGGVKRWMKIGPIQLQFSELAKIALIGVMADFWSRAGRNAPRSFGPWLMTLLLAGPIVALVFVQPHLSAASLLFLLPFFIAFYAGCSIKNIAKIVAPLIVLLGITVVLCQTHKMPGLKEYQQDRIAAHFGGGGDDRGNNYQALQGMRALTRGGILGTGPGGGLYKQGHLPAPHTDFILAVIGEEWGLLGVLGLLTIYGTMIFFCFHTGHSANSSFEALVCAGVGTLLGIQVICNAGVVTGMLPVTGMPLPLLSYGGSGMICTLLGLGLVLSVSRRYNCANAVHATSE